MASALAVGDVVVLSFSAQARGIQLYEVDCRHLMIRIPVVVRRNVSQNDESRAEWVTPMWLRIKMAFSPYVLNMRIAIFAFLREIMSLFDVNDARKRPHWWVSVLLCYKPTNALRYWNSLLFRSGALSLSEHLGKQWPDTVWCIENITLPKYLYNLSSLKNGEPLLTNLRRSILTGSDRRWTVIQMHNFVFDVTLKLTCRQWFSLTLSSVFV